MEQIDIDRLEMYKLAAKKCKEQGYPLTKDRIWDQVVSISIRSGTKEILAKHNSDIYFDELKKLRIIP